MEHKTWQRFYDPGTNCLLKYTKISLADQFTAWVKKHPDQPYIYYLERIITYEQANKMACKIANELIKVGMKKGDRIAIALPNIPEFIIMFLACLKIGVIVVPTNPFYTKRELLYQYRNSCAETIVCLDIHFDKNIQVMQELQEICKRIIVVSTDGLQSALGLNQNILYYHRLLNSKDAIEPEVNTSLDDLVLLFYTGGTTGVSKGCCITNANLIAVAAGWIESIRFFTNIANYKALATSPLYHIYGFQSLVNVNILVGGSIIIVPEVNADNILEAINKYEPNVWPTVPFLIRVLNQHPDLTNSKVNKIQYLASGAAPIPVKVMNELEKITGCPVIEGYGASETTNAVCSNPMQKRKVGSIGIPYVNVDCKVVDLETGIKEMPLGQTGELIFKGEQVIKEYWQNPTETARAFKDGWWYSGDIGYMDEDGFLFIVDRKKDVIICSGFNVFSVEVDEILNNHPKILEAAVIGVPDPKRGETVKAFIVVKPGEKLCESEIKEYCRQFMAAYKVPTVIEFISKIPRTPIQKVDRKALRALTSSTV